MNILNTVLANNAFCTPVIYGHCSGRPTTLYGHFKVPCLLRPISVEKYNRLTKLVLLYKVFQFRGWLEFSKKKILPCTKITRSDAVTV